MSIGRANSSVQAPSVMSAADQLRVGKGELPSSANIEKELPEFAKFWPRDDQGRIDWPKPDPANPGDLMKRVALEKFLLSFMRIFYPSEVEETSVWNSQRLFWFVQRDLKARGHAQWEKKFYDQAWQHAGKAFQNEEAGKAEELLEANPPSPSPAGRKPTDRTARMQLIRETIGVGRWRGYEIEANGTDNLQDRIALAAAFKDDPERDTPAKWELKFGRKHGRPSDRRTFADYVMSYDDAFEEDLGPALATLRQVYTRGALPRTFNDLRAFIGLLHGLGIDNATAVRLWDRAADWT